MLIPAALRAEFDRLSQLYPELSRWSLQVNPRLKRALGRCCFRFNRRTGETVNRRIEMSADVLRRNAGDHPEVIDILRHECAHALAGPDNGHNHVWKMWAVRLGARPLREKDGEKVGLKIQARMVYLGTCPTCGRHTWRRGRPRTRHPVCSCCFNPARQKALKEGKKLWEAQRDALLVGGFKFNRRVTEDQAVEIMKKEGR